MGHKTIHRELFIHRRDDPGKDMGEESSEISEYWKKKLDESSIYIKGLV